MTSSSVPEIQVHRPRNHRGRPFDIIVGFLYLPPNVARPSDGFGQSIDSLPPGSSETLTVSEWIRRRSSVPGPLSLPDGVHSAVVVSVSATDAVGRRWAKVRDPFDLPCKALVQVPWQKVTGD